jgi:hypothetical protein
MYQVVSHFRLRYIYGLQYFSLHNKNKERNKRKKKKKVDCSELRPGAPPAGWPVHPNQTAIGGLTHPGLVHPEKIRRADAPGRRHEISEYKILNDVSLFIVYII